MLAVALLVSVLPALGGAYVYQRCELAKELRALGVRREHVPTWVCIAYHESRLDTAARNAHSGDHGLLQISELYWCGATAAGKACGAPCSAFRDDDIADDVACALRIHAEHTRLQGDGFLAWVVYPHHCRHGADQYVADCNSNFKHIDDGTRYPKAYKMNDTKHRTENDTHTTRSRPRYLDINSIFRGSNELEKNYNEKSSVNWLNFKVDNIDVLELPASRGRVRRPTAAPAPSTAADPALLGIKPPSPRRIESDQFRRRKTIPERPFLKNFIYNEQKSSTTASPVKKISVIETSFNEDLAHNIFLNMSPSGHSKTSTEPVQQTKWSDLSKQNVETPQNEERSSIPPLTFDDLVRNPFLKSLPGFSTKPTKEKPLQISKASEWSRSSKDYKIISDDQSGLFINTNLYMYKKTANPHDGRIPATDMLSYEDLSRNLFLSNLIRSSKFKASSESPPRSIKPYYTIERTTTTQSTPLASSESRERSVPSSNRHAAIGTTRRGRVRYSTPSDKPTSDASTTTRPSTSARAYNIPRQRSKVNRTSITATTVRPNTDNVTEVSTVTPRVEIIQNATTKEQPHAATTVSEQSPNVTEETTSTMTLSTKSPLTPSWTRFWEKPRDTPMTTPRSTTKSDMRTKSATSILSIGTSKRSFYGNQTAGITTSEATPAKATQSVFDLYLRPTTRTPFEFTTSKYKSPYKLSIFSGGTTKLPAFYTASKFSKQRFV